MDALGHRHFERRESASHARTLLAACAEVGLDAAAAEAMLASDELVADVRRRGGATAGDEAQARSPLRCGGATARPCASTASARSRSSSSAPRVSPGPSAPTASSRP